MSDTENFEDARISVQAMIYDCDIPLLDRLKRAHESEIAELQRAYDQKVIDLQMAHEREVEAVRDPQRIGGTLERDSFEYALEQLREFRWQHATNDKDAIPYINNVARAHEQARKSEYARGYEDGRHSMDAEHELVALRLRGLRFDGGSHESLSRIAYAVYPCATGWTPESCAGLRDRLIDLLGGVRKRTYPTSTYDELGSERQKAVCELRKIHADAGGFVKALAKALGVEWQAPRVHQTLANVRDRLIHLLGGDEPTLSDLWGVWKDADGTCPNNNGTCPNDGATSSITDELREWASDRHCKGISHTDVLNIGLIADRIDEQFARVCQQQEAVLQKTIDKIGDELSELAANNDELAANNDELAAKCGENANLKAECERLHKRLDSITEAIECIKSLGQE